MSDVREWLNQLGLERYAAAFADAEVDLSSLRLLTEDDLRDLGLPLGPRRRILAELAQPRPAAVPAPPAPPPPVVTSATAERRQITVMFVDLVGSTELSTRMDPEHLGELLADYKGVVAREIGHAGGTIAKYLGDGVLAYFGWPQAHEDAAAIAIRCALGVRREVAQRHGPGGEALQTRIGIATGLVVVGGTTGSGTASEDTIAGEVLNLAARLQSLAAPDAIVVSGSTRAQIGQLFEVASLGTHALKGFDTPVEAWAVAREASHTNRFAAVRAIRSAFIGRERELQALVERWEEAREGSGRAVLVLGEAGIGKSRLGEVLHTRVMDEPHGYVGWQCSSFHQSKALYPVIEYLARAAEIVDADPPAEKLRKLADSLATVQLDDALPFFALLLSIPASAGYAEPDLAPAQRRAATIAALADWLRRIAEVKPLLLMLEDAHWADATTLELMTRVVAMVGGMAMLTIVTGRPDFTSPWGGRSNVSIIGLDRLGTRASEELVRAIADAGAVDEATLREIVARGEGNPLFLEELSVAVSGAVSAARQTIPDTLQSSLMGSLDQLGDAKETAQTCAVLGRRFARPLLARVAGGHAALLDINLSQLMAEEIIVPIGRASEGRFEFRHALVRDAAYESLLLSQRRRLHAACGEQLEQHFTEVVRTEPELLAYHFAQADQPAKASAYYEAAGDRAAESYSFAEAIASYRDAVRQNARLPTGEAGDRREVALLLKLGPALAIIRGVQHGEVRDVYVRAEAISRTLDDVDYLYKSVWGLWFNANVGRDIEGAQGFAQELVALSERSGDDGHELEALHCRWSSAFFRGDCAAAVSDSHHGSSLYQKDRHHALGLVFGGHDPGVCALAVRSGALVINGAIDDGMASIDAALTLAEELQHPHSTAHALMNALTAAVVGRQVEAASRYGQGLAEVSERYNFPPTIAAARYLLGWVEAQRSDPAAGLVRMRADFPGVAALGPMTLVYVVLYVEQLLRAGHADEALAVADEWLVRLKLQDAGLYVPELHRLRGECLVALGRASEGMAALERSLAIAERQGAHLLTMRTAASWLCAESNPTAAAALARALAALRINHDPPEVAEARALLAV